MAGVLNVCTANRCRSPLAQLFLSAALGSHGGSPPPPDGIAVSSAGVWTRGDEPIWPAAGEEARRRGLSTTGFRSRPITPQLVAEADLVLAATRALRDEVVTVVPAALRRTFTWSRRRGRTWTSTTRWAAVRGISRPRPTPSWPRCWCSPKG